VVVTVVVNEAPGWLDNSSFFEAGFQLEHAPVLTCNAVQARRARRIDICA
jgi:hypothetical protein